MIDRALTLTQPWAGLVAAGVKPIENRPRKMIAAAHFGQPFAIHASRVLDESIYDRIFSILPRLRADVGSTQPGNWWALSRITSAIIGVSTIDRVIDNSRSLSDDELSSYELRWFFGPIGYVLRNAGWCDAVPCKGSQGFWTIKGDVRELVNKRAIWRRAA